IDIHTQKRGIALRKRASENETKPSKPLAKRILKVVLIVLAVPISIITIVVTAALIFTALQKPVFVNKELDLHHKLYIPELLQPRIENGEKVFDLTVQKGEQEFLPGKRTNTIGYNGSYLGPTIRARKGDKVRMNVTNKLPDPTTSHWHGMELPAAMDGAAHQIIKSGENWQPSWTITNEAASLWYHPHLMGKTGEQVYRGLAGAFIIDDDNSDRLNLPKEYGIDDIPLIVQDRSFDQNNQFVYDPGHTDVLGHTGMHGDKILVNGTYAPYADVPAKQIRLRILNGSNSRRYDFGFEDGRTFHQIATDGGLLVGPVARTHMTLAPAERAEIVIDLANEARPITLISNPVREESRVLRFMRTVLRAERDENQKFKIIELRPQPVNAKPVPLPQKLNTIDRLKAIDAVKTRQFTLDPKSKSINGKEMNHSRIDQLVHSGDTEIWEIRNQSGVYHPFHIHGVQFQILDWSDLIGKRRPPKDYERGWKDTVLVPNAETVRVIMRMPKYSDPHLPYMFHCHILEHEDMGMMGQFMVVDRSVKREDIFVQSKLTESGLEAIHTH
ncbi:MAG TPA: multicopper oxidase domain-containing protein, partial [Candidatus Saccharimonadales bacterium]|nr:multicopper oxidase domain-containing protein [Candidatus Saccharimonadales bacterium]